MSTQRYSVTPHPIETLLTWVKSGEIAIPEIQRPFVWDATKVRNLLDSLYQGSNPFIQKNSAWIPDGGASRDRGPHQRLRNRPDQDRVQSPGGTVRGGNSLRKAIDYFCHLAVAPEFHGRILKGDPGFASSEFFSKMTWLKDANDDIYDPSYTDMLRVAFTSEFRRGKLQDLVALLSGRNFETKQYEDTIAEKSFARLKKAVLNFINQTNFERFVMILRSAGFVSRDLIGGQNPLNFAYIVYLQGRAEGLPAAEIERLVRRWFVMSMLRGRYSSGNPETNIDLDIRQIDSRGVTAHVEAVIEAELSESFWANLLPQLMETSSTNSPYFLVFQAAQVKLGERGFLSRDITVQDLLLNRSDVHHLFPRDYLKKLGVPRGRYNQVANYALAQSEINVAIGNKAPSVYFRELLGQCKSGKRKYGGITDLDELMANLQQHCIPEGIFDGLAEDYDLFLTERRKLMVAKIKSYFAKL